MKQLLFCVSCAESKHSDGSGRCVSCGCVKYVRHAFKGGTVCQSCFHDHASPAVTSLPTSQPIPVTTTTSQPPTTLLQPRKSIVSASAVLLKTDGGHTESSPGPDTVGPCVVPSCGCKRFVKHAFKSGNVCYACFHTHSSDSVSSGRMQLESVRPATGVSDTSTPTPVVTKATGTGMDRTRRSSMFPVMSSSSSKLEAAPVVTHTQTPQSTATIVTAEDGSSGSDVKPFVKTRRPTISTSTPTAFLQHSGMLRQDPVQSTSIATPLATVAPCHHCTCTTFLSHKYMASKICQSCFHDHAS